MTVNNVVIGVGIILSGVVTAGYLIDAFARKGSPRLHNVVNFFLSGAGFATGGKLSYCALVVPLPPEFANDWLYVLIGGIAVIWASVVSMTQPFIDLHEKHPMPTKKPASIPAHARVRFHKR